jgi:sulfite exporter TauE/SafE/copper chaperone CopZ
MSQSSPQERFAAVCIGGMTCASCELLLEKKLRAVPGVKHVDVDHKSGIARITAKVDQLPSAERISEAIEKAGYSVIDENAPSISSLSPDKRKWMEIGGALLIIFAAYKLLQTFDLVSLAPSTSGALSIGGIFLIGLVAGTSSCLAVTGGLLLALAAKHNEIHQAETPWQKFKPLLHFNLGRLVSYFVLGGLVGILGQSITLSTRMSGYMNIIVAFVMLYLALSILEIIPKGSFPIRPPKKLSRWIANLSESDHPAAPFSMGALTFFLPCGFTQSLQLAALASDSFLTGALTMGVFAFGTLPSLLGISAISSTATGGFSRMFLRFSGTLVLLLALFNLNSGFALTGVDLSRVFAGGSQQAGAPAAVINGSVQEVSMAVTSYGYEPKNLTIKVGVPVRWKINGDEAYGCTSVMTIPSLNISQPLRQGENIIEFTATQKGQLAFMCSMGMVRGSFTVI